MLNKKKTIKRVKTINSVVNSEGSESTINLSDSVLHHTSGNIQDCDDFLNISGSDGDDADEVEQLRVWAATSGIPHVKFDELLKILRKRLLPELPKSTKTFLGTSAAEYKIQKFDDTSEFVYFGVTPYLTRNLYITKYNAERLELLINFDGIPLFNSSSKQFWPILGMIYHKVIRYKPFPIAIYVGDHKPCDIN